MAKVALTNGSMALRRDSVSEAVSCCRALRSRLSMSGYFVLLCTCPLSETSDDIPRRNDAHVRVTHPVNPHFSMEIT